MVDTLTELIAPVLHMRLTSLYMAGKPFKFSLRCRKKQSSGLNWRGMGDQGTSEKKNAQNLFSYFFYPGKTVYVSLPYASLPGFTRYAELNPIYGWKAL